MSNQPSAEGLNTSAKIVSAVAAVFFLAVVTRFAWLSDDAFIAFRAISNLVEGHGLVSNVGERVQAFTNPLWTLLLVPLHQVSGDIYGTAIFMSLLVCALTAGVVWKLHEGAWPAAFGFALCTLSYGFVSFSSSGLENGLAHLLLAAFFYTSWRRSADLLGLWLLGALVICNRFNHGLLVLPTLVFSLRGRPLRQWRPALLGLVPLLLWLLFALVYYGFPFPNTAYAELNSAIPRGQLLFQGFAYLVDVLLTDPIVLPVIGLALLAQLAVMQAQPRSPGALTAALGVAAYLGYVCWIGGDFMSGRFLTAPFFVAVLLLSLHVEAQPRAALGLVAVAVLAGLRMLAPMPADSGTVCMVPPAGIVDERACYLEHTGIAQNVRTKKWMQHPYAIEGVQLSAAGQPVVVNARVGLGGLAAGASVHLIDPLALTDPFLARLTPARPEQWRTGHLHRVVPPEYLTSVQTRQNHLVEPCARALLADLWLITRGPLLAGDRWAAILRRNFGAGTCPGR